MRTFSCIKCQKQFQSDKFCKSRIPKYCSNKCYAETVRKNETKNCLVCNSVMDRQNIKFCSVSCRASLQIGKSFSDEHKKKLSDVKRGKRPAHMHNPSVLKKISIALTGRKIQSIQNERHYLWKGKKASYTAFHAWLKRRYGKASMCEYTHCKYPRVNKNGKILKEAKNFNWALRHSESHGHDRGAYIQLCRSCHSKYDMNLIEI